MSNGAPEHVQRTIADACAEVDRLSAELAGKKSGVNVICQMFKLPPVYTDVAQPERANFSNGGRPDRYFNKPLATVVRSILAARHEADIGPATVEALYEEMLAGGFDFDDKSEENSKRALAVSLAKNNTVFRRMKNGTWSLAEWYGGVKAPRAKAKAATAEVAGAPVDGATTAIDDVLDEVFGNLDEAPESDEKATPMKPR